MNIFTLKRQLYRENKVVINSYVANDRVFKIYAFDTGEKYIREMDATRISAKINIFNRMK